MIGWSRNLCIQPQALEVWLILKQWIGCALDSPCGIILHLRLNRVTSGLMTWWIWSDDVTNCIYGKHDKYAPHAAGVLRFYFAGLIIYQRCMLGNLKKVISMLCSRREFSWKNKMYGHTGNMSIQECDSNENFLLKKVTTANQIRHRVLQPDLKTCNKTAASLQYAKPVEILSEIVFSI